eukprot:3528232-Rhodomonas_salina.2
MRSPVYAIPSTDAACGTISAICYAQIRCAYGGTRARRRWADMEGPTHRLQSLVLTSSCGTTATTRWGVAEEFCILPTRNEINALVRTPISSYAFPMRSTTALHIPYADSGTDTGQDVCSYALRTKPPILACTVQLPAFVSPYRLPMRNLPGTEVGYGGTKVGGRSREDQEAFWRAVGWVQVSLICSYAYNLRVSCTQRLVRIRTCCLAHHVGWARSVSYAPTLIPVRVCVALHTYA